MCKEAINEIKKRYKNYDDMPSAADYLLKSLKVSAIPTPIIKIVREAGFSVQRQKFDDANLSGVIAIDEELKSTLGSSMIISVNNQDNLGHQRFTIAHEFAHYIFDFDKTTRISYYDTYRTTDDAVGIESERIASYFAANLLMPADLFTNEFQQHLVSNDMYETTAKLAEVFQVSAAAVKRRIEELSLNVSS